MPVPRPWSSTFGSRRPGDLPIEFAKPGYAQEVHQMRLGSDHPRGRMRVTADLREDAPVTPDARESGAVVVDSDDPTPAD